MTKVTIEIDTGLDETITSDAITEARSRVKLAANKIGLLSTIDLTQQLSQAFWSAVNQTKEEKPNAGYKSNDIKNGKSDLKTNKSCKVIATAGGMPAFTALNSDNDIPFVSVVGMVPSSINSQCAGGISLESYKSSLRRDYLVGLGHNPANIYLLTNNNSSVFHQAEINDWSSGGTVLVSYVGGDGTGTNDDTKFSWDWVGGGGQPAIIPGNATGIVISDDPFFQTKQSSLMGRANTWLGSGANRRVVFPNYNYSTLGQSNASQMIIRGCDLVAAYRLLGALASSASLNQNVNFGFIRLAWQP
jgi:hypothetical protein